VQHRTKLVAVNVNVSYAPRHRMTCGKLKFAEKYCLIVRVEDTETRVSDGYDILFILHSVDSPT
jgi:hypothetical protein